jgi:hypothetical protein
MKADPRQFRWYKYNGRTVEIEVNDLVIELKKNAVFGLKKGKYWIYTDAESLDHKIRLDDYDAARLVNNSKGWSGKVGRYNVEAGEGGLDVRKVADPSDTLVVIQADSSNLHRIVYNPTKKILYIEFRSGDRWAYYDVTQKEADGIRDAKSQGSFFHYMIKTQKRQKKVKDFK